MNWLENVVIRNKEIENERVELTNKGSLYFLGPNLIVRNCTLVCKIPGRQLSFDSVRFVDCTFDVKQELKNHQSWVATSLKGCRFKGKFTGCDFGHWPEYSSLPGDQHGFIEDCDFSEARMDGCRIMGCDPATIRFPKWPCFTLLDPIGHAAELRGARWPDLFKRVIIDDLHDDPPQTRSITYHAPSVAKFLNTTEEALRAVIETFDCFVY